jgi:hypothetical protein
MKIGTKSVLAGAHCFFLHPVVRGPDMVEAVRVQLE